MFQLDERLLKIAGNTMDSLLIDQDKKNLCWELVLFIGISISACQIHKYAHIPPGRLPTAVRFLQKYKIIQDCSHHVKHHIDGKNTNYCLITPFLNPILSKIQFWRFMEFLLKPVLGELRK